MMLVVPVLVDGNNVMHALADAGVDAGRSMLCELLIRYGARRDVAVGVVFDGSPPRPDEAKRIADPHISIRYSGGRTADEVLADLIRASSAPRALTVVSSDRGVQRQARRRRCRVVDSATFARRLTAEPPPPAEPDEPAAKRRGLSDGQAARWIEEFGIGDADDVD